MRARQRGPISFSGCYWTFLAKEGISDNLITFTMGNLLKDVPQSTEEDTIIVKKLVCNFYWWWNDQSLGKLSWSPYKRWKVYNCEQLWSRSWRYRPQCNFILAFVVFTLWHCVRQEDSKLRVSGYSWLTVKFLRLVMALHCLSCYNVTKNTSRLDFTSVGL